MSRQTALKHVLDYENGERSMMNWWGKKGVSVRSKRNGKTWTW